MTKAETLKQVIGLEHYRVTDFWAICPYEPDDMLIDTRKKEPLNTWRKIGMSWYVLSGYTSAASGEFFSRDHASVLHAIDTTREMLEIGDALITQAVELMKNQSKLPIAGAMDKQPMAALNLELHLSRLRPHLFDPTQFYCSIHAIGSRLGSRSARCKNQCNACKS